MKTILVILISLFLTSAFADLGVSIYSATAGSGKTTSAGCVYVSFTVVSCTGTIGNATLSNNTFSIPVVSGYQGGVGQRLNAIPYSVSSGTMIITEVR